MRTYRRPGALTGSPSRVKQCMDLVSQGMRLLAVVAHPDDESLEMGGTLARYASEGVETYVLTATRGERGRSGEVAVNSPGELGAIREAEQRAACRVLGVFEVGFLDYRDGAVDEADPCEAAARIEAHIRRIRPHVVVTFGPEGGYGHPDHIAISQFTTAAIVRAGGAGVCKLYYLAWTAEKWAAYQAALKTLRSRVDGVERQAMPWPDWAITTRIDCIDYWPTVWRAVSCHRTQMSMYRNLERLPELEH